MEMIKAWALESRQRGSRERSFFFTIKNHLLFMHIVIAQLLSHVWLFATHGLQYSRLPSPSLSPWVCWNSCPLSQWCHPTISSCVAPSPLALSLSQCQGLYQNWLFLSGGQIGASASAPVLPVNIQDWFLLGLSGLISLLSKGLSSIFSSTTIWKHQFFGT